MSLLYELSEGRLVPGVRARIKGLRPELARLLAAFPKAEALGVLREAPAHRPLFAEIGAATLSMLADARAMATFIGAVVRGFAAATRRPRLDALAGGRASSSRRPASTPCRSSRSSACCMGLIIAFEAAQPLGCSAPRSSSPT